MCMISCQNHAPYIKLLSFFKIHEKSWRALLYSMSYKHYKLRAKSYKLRAMSYDIQAILDMYKLRASRYGIYKNGACQCCSFLPGLLDPSHQCSVQVGTCTIKLWSSCCTIISATTRYVPSKGLPSDISTKKSSPFPPE
jgi:hypothetical protein